MWCAWYLVDIHNTHAENCHTKHIFCHDNLNSVLWVFRWLWHTVENSRNNANIMVGRIFWALCGIHWLNCAHKLFYSKILFKKGLNNRIVMVLAIHVKAILQWRDVCHSFVSLICKMCKTTDNLNISLGKFLIINRTVRCIAVHSL